MNNQLVSVSDLMQITHPGHRLLVADKHIKENEILLSGSDKKIKAAKKVKQTPRNKRWSVDITV